MKHTQEIQDKIKGMKDLGFSSRKIAKAVFGSESQKSTVNDILKRREEQRKFLRESFSRGASTFEESYANALAVHESVKSLPGYCPATKQEDNSRILFISDLHIPYHHPDTFEFLQYLKDKYNPTRVICLGDELDKHGLSYHDHDPDLYSAGHELQASIPFVKKLEQMFPVMDIVESNHGSLVWRKAKTNGIPRHYIKSYRDVLGVGEGWKWFYDLTVDLPNGQQCYVHHGKVNDVIKMSQSMGMCAVSGHFHERFKIEFWANPNGLYWGMQAGCLVDDKSYAMAYNNTNLRRPIIGTGLVIDSQPVLEPMVLSTEGRWIKS